MGTLVFYKLPDGPAWRRRVRPHLQAKFRAESQALTARMDAGRAGGKHTYEKGMRREQAAIEFLREFLPPRYGVARGEIVDSKGGVSRQCDIVVYDALHAPVLQRAEASQLFPAECVYAVIEVKPSLDRGSLPKAVANIAAAKALDRSAIVAQHGGHRLYHGPKANPPIFGAVLSLHSPSVHDSMVPCLREHQQELPREQWVDAVCVLDEALIYWFEMDPKGRGLPDWVPTVQKQGACLGYYESGEDTLLLFCLFLLHQLNAKELFPPDLLRYIDGLGTPALHVQVEGLPPL